MNRAIAGNKLEFEISSVERLLARTPLLALGEFRCPTDAPQFRGGGPQPCAYVAFPRTTVRISPYRGRTEVCTPALASFYNQGDVYDRHALGDRGDNSDWIAIAPALLEELCGDGGFAGCFAPIANEAFLAQQRLFRRANSEPGLSALQAEEAVLALLRRMLADADHGWKRTAKDAVPVRPETERRRRRMVDEAKQLIAVRFRDEFSLAELARMVNGSPGHLARAFRAVTGTTVHDYRTQLRLRAALPLLPDFRHDISSLALELGFSSHSHFGDLFRRQFGLTPSDYAGQPRLN